MRLVFRHSWHRGFDTKQFTTEISERLRRNRSKQECPQIAQICADSEQRPNAKDISQSAKICAICGYKRIGFDTVVS